VSNPAVSILMPCFNAADFLEEALDSLLAQTFTDFTLYIIDDGSQDGSVNILKRYAASDKRIHLILDSENRGIIYRRNQLLNLCQSEYACWADADDVYMPSRIEMQMNVLRSKPEIGMCSCNFVKQYENQRKEITVSQAMISAEYLLFYNHVLNPGAMFRMAVVNKNNIRFDSGLSGASDYKFWLQMSQVTQFYQIQECLVVYRVHQAQESTAQVRRQIKGHLETVQYGLTIKGVNLDEDAIAELLIFPKEKLGETLSPRQGKRALRIIDQLLKTLNVDNRDHLIQVLIELARAHCRRIGLSGLWFFLSRFKFKGLSSCNLMGLELFWKMCKRTMELKFSPTQSAPR